MFGDIYNIQFPGKYLRNILDNSVNTLSNYLKSKEELPIDLFNEVYNYEDVLEGDALKYLDNESIEEFEEVKWQINKSK